MTVSSTPAAGRIETPWGPSDSLRDRRLPPGPGTPAAEVARNQRGRLFGAMVASVSERGYAATRLSDLSEISGVARTSFYQLFPDKEACFVAAAEKILAAAVEVIVRPNSSREEQVRHSASSFADLVVAQPAAARMCLIEADAVGVAGLRLVERATAQIEADALAAAVSPGEDREAWEAMISAQVGGLIAIARTRLCHGREGALPGLARDFSDLVLSYGPPPEPLRLRTRPPPPVPETVDAHDHGERAIKALTLVAAEQGYANATIEQVMKRAAMSPTTFYANFRDKEDALMAAIDSAGAQMLAAILPALHRSVDWPHGARAAFGALFNFLASRPALARLMMVEVHAAGPAAVERREEALRPLEVVLKDGVAGSPRVPAIAGEAVAGGAYALAHKQLREGRPEALPGLAPICTYLALAPFIGAEEAVRAANADGRLGGLRGPAGAARRPLRDRIHHYLSDRSAGAEEIAGKLGVAVEQVRAELAAQRRAGLVEVTREEGADGQVEESFTAPDMAEIGTADWGRMDLAEREKISRQILRLIESNADSALDAGTFDARLDRHLSNFALRLDEQGWTDLGLILDAAFDQVRQVEIDSAARQLEFGDGGIEARLVLALFEMPEAE